MRISGFILVAVGLAWLTLTQFASLLPKAGNYSARLQKLPVQDSYTRQQVRDVVWEVSAFRWSFPEQETYSREQVTNILQTACMNSKQTRDGTAPSVAVPVVLLVAGAFCVGFGFGRDDVKPATESMA